MPQPIVIVGASTRAAASSARRAGLMPFCCDMFGDTDLARMAEQFKQVDDYPRGLIAAVASFPPAPWMYVGAIENSPDIVASIAESRPLWGIGATELARIRNPKILHAAFESGEASVLPVRASGDCPPERDGSWLLKPIRGAGGRGISIWNATAATPHEPHYFQRFFSGRSLSAIFVGRAGGSLQLYGVTRQLTGDADFHARPFAYCGSIGPISPGDTLRRELAAITAALAPLNLMGLFGVDFVFDGVKARVTEVNPRYSASVEVLERAGTQSLFLRHAAAFDTAVAERINEQPGYLSEANAIHGKAIVFATRDFTCPNYESLPNCPEIADIPVPGSTIHKTHPICTVFAKGHSECEVEALLKRSADWVTAVSGWR